MNETNLLESQEVEDIGVVSLLYHLTGQSEEALQTITNTFKSCNEQLKQNLRSLFNIKDLEVFLHYSILYEETFHLLAAIIADSSYLLPHLPCNHLLP